jgi:hypothetical protein
MKMPPLKHCLLIWYFLFCVQQAGLHASPAIVCSDTIFRAFVTAGNEWVVDEAVPSPGWPARILRFTFSNDSIFKDGKYYHELIYSENMSGGPWLSEGSYFREENGRTYKWLEDAPERLIYDFHFGIGDSLPGMDSNQATRYVVQVGSETLLDGIPRKAIIFNSVCGPSRWVEGIGEIEDFLYSEVFCSLWDAPPLSIRCFSTNGQLLYLRPDLSNCYTSSTNDLALHPVRVFPNPASDILLLETDQDEPVQHLTLYNALGTAVLTSGQCTNNQVPISGLGPGLYTGKARFLDGSEGWFRVVVAR